MATTRNATQNPSAQKLGLDFNDQKRPEIFLIYLSSRLGPLKWTFLRAVFESKNCSLCTMNFLYTSEHHQQGVKYQNIYVTRVIKSK